ncbi:hypothetical protein Pfo_026938 [Paulownia fortunei]|nr:hypothetical protein Pfo_026938 [Paulownia fortunei]
MERQKKGMKQKKNKKEGFEKRSPLQHLNGLQIRKPNSKKSLNLSSSSAAAAVASTSVSVEAPKACLRFLHSSNSSSAASSAAAAASSSSSRTNLDRKPKTLSTITNTVSVKSSAATLKVRPRSKENEVPRKPFSQKSKKNQPPCLNMKQYGKTNNKHTYKNAQRSKLCSGQGNPVEKLKKGSEGLESKLKNSQENGSGEPPIKQFGVSFDSNLDCIESCTPAGRIASACGLDSVSFDGRENVREESVSKTANGNSDTDVKTPPVEASVSPEIQCGSHSKMLVAKSAATPVCYGAGHLLSGVTDKRKCRRRGSLKGGCEKVNLFDDEKNDGNVISGSQDSSIPLLGEASVRWLLSPCSEGLENQGSDSEKRLDQCKMTRGNASISLELLSSPSTLCGKVSNLGCDNSNYTGSGSVGHAASQRTARIIILSPRKNPEFQGFLGHSIKKMHEHLLATTPNSTSNCNSVSSGEGAILRHNVIENNSAFSLGSLSCGNIIQTPNSDSSSYGCVGGSKVEVHHRNSVQFELDSITETLNKVGLSPRSEMSISDAPGIGFQCADMDLTSSISLAQLQKNVDSVCSWVSDSTIENLALSQMRISWRDGLVHRIDEAEFDCCRCLSDEEIDADRFSDKQLMLYPLSQSGGDRENDLGINRCRSHLGTESGANEENDLGIDSDVSPILLEHEPCIYARGKEKLCPHRLNTSVESICTNGGDLVASGDSDWTYYWENQLFQVK